MATVCFSKEHLFKFLDRRFPPLKDEKTSIIIRTHQLSWMVIFFDRPFSLEGIEMKEATESYFRSNNYRLENHSKIALELTLLPELTKDEGSVESGKPAIIDSIQLIWLKNLSQTDDQFSSNKWNVHLLPPSKNLFQMNRTEVFRLLNNIQSDLESFYGSEGYLQEAITNFHTEQMYCETARGAGSGLYDTIIKVLPDIAKYPNTNELVEKLDKLARHCSQYNPRVCLWIKS